MALLPAAAHAWGDGRTMGAGSRMAEEDADLFRDLGSQGVFDSAGVLVHHVRINSEGLEEQAFG